MDLVKLGTVAGIGGIAVGAVVMIVRAVIAKSGKTTPEQLALYRLIAIGAFVIGGLGIVASMAGGGGATTTTTVTVGACAAGAAHDATGNKINCGTVPP